MPSKQPSFHPTSTPAPEDETTTLSIRLPVGMKRALAQFCKDYDQTPSQVLRRLINQELYRDYQTRLRED